MPPENPGPRLGPENVIGYRLDGTDYFFGTRGGAVPGNATPIFRNQQQSPTGGQGQGGPDLSGLFQQLRGAQDQFAQLSQQFQQQQKDNKTVAPTPSQTSAANQLASQVGNQQPQQQPQVPLEQALQNLRSGGLTGPQAQQAESSLRNFYRGFFESRPAGEAPAAGAEPRAAMQEYQSSQPQPPQVQQDTPAVTEFVSTDPFIKSMTDQLRTFSNYDQDRPTLVQEYQNLMRASGLQDVDAQLLNLKNVIEGTEDDIRTEVTKAGGFATNSQVMALAANRSKPLITKYNNLVSLRDSKQKYLDTLVNLTQQDREEVGRRMDRTFNFQNMILNHRDKMMDNARNNYQNIISTAGYGALAEAVGGDPYYQDLAEKSLGLPKGVLSDRSFISTADAKKLGGKDNDIGSVNEKLLGLVGSDGFTNTDEYAKLRAKSKMSPTEFDNRFGYLVNPNARAALGISGASAGGLFTQTQLNNGAALFGSMEGFSALSPDAKNIFINQGTELQKRVKFIEKSLADKSSTPDELKEQINSSNLPQEVKDWLLPKVKDDSSGSSWFSRVKSFFGF